QALSLQPKRCPSWLMTSRRCAKNIRAFRSSIEDTRTREKRGNFQYSDKRVLLPLTVWPVDGVNYTSVKFPLIRKTLPGNTCRAVLEASAWNVVRFQGSSPSIGLLGCVAIVAINCGDGNP